jgi:hypothetical protein
MQKQTAAAKEDIAAIRGYVKHLDEVAVKLYQAVSKSINNNRILVLSNIKHHATAPDNICERVFQGHIRVVTLGTVGFVPETVGKVDTSTGVARAPQQGQADAVVCRLDDDGDGS